MIESHKKKKEEDKIQKARMIGEREFQKELEKKQRKEASLRFERER